MTLQRCTVDDLSFSPSLSHLFRCLTLIVTVWFFTFKKKKKKPMWYEHIHKWGPDWRRRFLWYRELQCRGSLLPHPFFFFGTAQLTVNVVNVVPTSWCHHVFQVCNKIIFLISFVGNRGTFTRGYKVMVLDFEFLYHLLYLIICCLGVFLHVFFYSLLVRVHMYTSTTSTRHLPPELRSKNEKTWNLSILKTEKTH